MHFDPKLFEWNFSIFWNRKFKTWLEHTQVMDPIKIFESWKQNGRCCCKLNLAFGRMFLISACMSTFHQLSLLDKGHWQEWGMWWQMFCPSNARSPQRWKEMEEPQMFGNWPVAGNAVKQGIVTWVVGSSVHSNNKASICLACCALFQLFLSVAEEFQCPDASLGSFVESAPENSNLEHNFFFEKIVQNFFKHVVKNWSKPTGCTGRLHVSPPTHPCLFPMQTLGRAHSHHDSECIADFPYCSCTHFPLCVCNVPKFHFCRHPSRSYQPQAMPAISSHFSMKQDCQLWQWDTPLVE